MARDIFTVVLLEQQWMVRFRGRHSPAICQPRRGYRRGRGGGMQSWQGEPRWCAGARAGRQQRVPHRVDLRHRSTPRHAEQTLALLSPRYRRRCRGHGRSHHFAISERSTRRERPTAQRSRQHRERRDRETPRSWARSGDAEFPGNPASSMAHVLPRSLACQPGHAQARATVRDGHSTPQKSRITQLRCPVDA